MSPIVCSEGLAGARVPYCRAMDKIASLVPSATEMLFALGLGGNVVGVTHECDYPPPARQLPHLTATVLPAGLSATEIDTAVKRVVGEAGLSTALTRNAWPSCSPT